MRLVTFYYIIDEETYNAMNFKKDNISRMCGNMNISLEITNKNEEIKRKEMKFIEGKMGAKKMTRKEIIELLQVKKWNHYEKRGETK